MRYYHRKAKDYTPALKKIAELFMLPFLRQKPIEVRDEDFLDYIFSVDKSVIKTYICTKPGEVKLFQPRTPSEDYLTPQTVELKIGDIVTVRKVEGSLKMDIEIDRQGEELLYRAFPSKWKGIRKFLESREELKIRAGRGPDTIRRNISKFVNRGLTLDQAARITYVLAGRIKG